MPAPLEKLDESKVVTGTGSPQASGSVSPDTSLSAATQASAPTPTSVAASANASTDQSMPNGSIDTCGSNGGQNCKTGMCCSAKGSEPSTA